MKTPPPVKDFAELPLTMLVEHMCALLQVHESTLYRRIRAGHVPAFQRFGTGRGVRYEWHKPDVERWFNNQRQSFRRAV